MWKGADMACVGFSKEGVSCGFFGDGKRSGRRDTMRMEVLLGDEGRGGGFARS